MSDADHKLTALRAGIDALDDHLLQLLSARSRLVREIWAIKEDAGKERFDPSREDAMRQRLLTRADQLGLDRDAVAAVFAAIIGKELQKR